MFVDIVREYLEIATKVLTNFLAMTILVGLDCYEFLFLTSQKISQRQ